MSSRNNYLSKDDRKFAERFILVLKILAESLKTSSVKIVKNKQQIF